MAHSPIFRHESPDPQSSRGTPAVSDRGAWAEPEAASQLARWQSILSSHGGGSVSADLALDLVLNEIVEMAREATRADAAAIALARDGEIVCRATTGDGAPDLGTRLNTDSGLTAASVQTGTWQRCDDSESDPRVDSDLCRRLGVRCILVVPVMRDEEALGLIEIFSGQAAAFGEREVRTLQVLSRSVVENIAQAGRVPAKAEAAPAAEVAGRREAPGTETNRAEDGEKTHPLAETADFWTGALMVAVVVLAVILGWMVGRGERGSRASFSQSEAVLQKVAQQNQAQAGRVEAGTNNAAKPAPAETAAGGASGELIVYQDGRKVFPKASRAKDAQMQSSTATTEVRPAIETSKIQNGPARISPEVAAAMVTRRVEPEYPQAARERGVQGAVVLDALVGKDGVVEKFTAIHGDPDLAAAASAAVRQWQFKPYQSEGRAEAFQTEITVKFRLP